MVDRSEQEIKDFWDPPLVDIQQRRQERATEAGTPIQVETTVKPMGGVGFAAFAGESRTRPEEWVPEHRDEPGEPHSYGGTPEDADRIVNVDDEAYERA